MTQLITNKKDIKRVKTYIKGFDNNLEGGIPTGFVNLIAGTSGTMKSSIGFNILYNEAVAGKSCVYLSLEQSANSLLNHMISLGYDTKKIQLLSVADIGKLSELISKIKSAKKGVLTIIDVGFIRKEIKGVKKAGSDWLNVFENIVKKIKTSAKLDHVVLDSLSALYSLSEFKTNPRSKVFYTFEFLRDLEITSFIITEIPADSTRIGEYGIEDYLSDGILKLNMVRSGRKVRREISIVKMRATDANTDIFVLDYKAKQFRALAKLIE